MMDTTKVFHYRQSFTIIELLRDFGGFGGAILLVVGTLVSFYSEEVYKHKIAQQLYHGKSL